MLFMQRLLFLSVLSIIMCVACSKKITNSPFIGNWSGGYFADNTYFGTWSIIIDNNGGITGKIISAPALQSYEFGVIGSVNSNGLISFTASISPTIEWKFEGTLNGNVANGAWIATSIPGNPPNKIWNGDKQ